MNDHKPIDDYIRTAAPSTLGTAYIYEYWVNIYGMIDITYEFYGNLRYSNDDW